MHASLNAMTSLTLVMQLCRFLKKSHVRATKFSVSHDEVSPAPIFLHPIRRLEQQAAAWCRAKRKIDEKDFWLWCSACERDGEGKDSPSTIAIKEKGTGEDSFRTQIVSQEKSSDFQSFKLILRTFRDKNGSIDLLQRVHHLQQQQHQREHA